MHTQTPTPWSLRTGSWSIFHVLQVSGSKPTARLLPFDSHVLLLGQDILEICRDHRVNVAKRFHPPKKYEYTKQWKPIIHTDSTRCTMYSVPSEVSGNYCIRRVIYYRYLYRCWATHKRCKNATTIRTIIMKMLVGKQHRKIGLHRRSSARRTAR